MANKDNIRKWVEALRSGEYKQGKGTLKKEVRGETRYCCFGVGCEVAIADGVQMKVEQFMEANRTVFSFDGDDAMPTELFYQWLGVPCGMNALNLAAKNDRGVRFKTIANLIEKEYLAEE